jgi:fucose permease
MPAEATPGSERREHAGLLLALSYVGFVSLGLPDTVLGAAWPAIRAELGLPLDTAGAALLVTTAGVVLSSVWSGRLRQRWGNGAVLVSSTLLAALGLLINAGAAGFGHMLLAASVAGLGGGAIDACLNEFVARRYSARHMNWLHAFWGVGASLGPMVVAGVLARGGSWRLAYAALGSVELILVLSFVQTRRFWNHDPLEAAAPGTEGGGGARRRGLWSVGLFFAYGGLEASTGLWAATLLVETRHASAALASLGVALYWAGLCAGRFLIGAKADAWGPARVLRWTVWAALAAAAALAIPGTLTCIFMLALALLGLALAPIYPLAMHDTPRRFGAELGAKLVGYQVAAAALGVASVPWLLGFMFEGRWLAGLPLALCGLALVVAGLEWLRAA